MLLHIKRNKFGRYAITNKFPAMKKYCTDHLFTEVLSICHGCGFDFCEECLSEGKEYYYCKKPECQKMLKEELGEEAPPTSELSDKDHVAFIPVYETCDSAKIAFLKSLLEESQIGYINLGEYSPWHGGTVTFAVEKNHIEEVKEILEVLNNSGI